MKRKCSKSVEDSKTLCSRSVVINHGSKYFFQDYVQVTGHTPYDEPDADFIL